MEHKTHPVFFSRERDIIPKRHSVGQRRLVFEKFEDTLTKEKKHSLHKLLA